MKASPAPESNSATGMLTKRKLVPFILSIPLIGAVAFFGPLSPEGWKSACGCMPADWEFVRILSIEAEGSSFPASVDLDRLDAERVASGFRRKIPVGSSMQEIKETSRFMESTCEEVNARLYRCDYWLQFKRTSARGYSVSFHLSERQQLVSVEAKSTTREKKQAL
ncbi:hypothetical protein [Acidovorax sp.]|uniref:hypothetical protein n=1 Tax=Acidovorax sp. TaxID=1872122 RepID=UPI0025C6AB80|nr:hypothetical protein [Acidovorax sp.]MBW8463937.1 hypothetical protein [Acidovorax sp.]